MTMKSKAENRQLRTLLYVYSVPKLTRNPIFKVFVNKITLPGHKLRLCTSIFASRIFRKSKMKFRPNLSNVLSLSTRKQISFFGDISKRSHLLMKIFKLNTVLQKKKVVCRRSETSRFWQLPYRLTKQESAGRFLESIRMRGIFQFEVWNSSNFVIISHSLKNQ